MTGPRIAGPTSGPEEDALVREVLRNAMFRARIQALVAESLRATRPPEERSSWVGRVRRWRPSGAAAPERPQAPAASPFHY